MIELPDHLLLEHFYRLGKDQFALLYSPLPKGDAGLEPESDPNLDFGLLSIDRLRLGKDGVYVGYRINVLGKHAHNPYFLMSYRGTDKLKPRLKLRDYPQLLVKLDGMKIIGNQTMVVAVSGKKLAITHHLDHP
jgi:hypothetical protein